MAYTPTNNELGLQPIAVSSTTQNHPLGKTIRAYDPTYGDGEFIYLLGVISTIVGSLVSYNGSATVNSVVTPTWQTTLAAVTANQGVPLAVAMSANVAAAYGWYQISGNAVTATNGTLAAGPGKVYLAGSGQVTSTQANGAEVLNAVNVTATGTPAANQAIIEINRPFAQGQAV